MKDIIKINKSKGKISLYYTFIKCYFISVIVYSMFEKNLFSLTSGLSLVTFCLVFSYILSHKKTDNYNSKLIEEN